MVLGMLPEGCDSLPLLKAFITSVYREILNLKMQLETVKDIQQTHEELAKRHKFSHSSAEGKRNRTLIMRFNANAIMLPRPTKGKSKHKRKEGKICSVSSVAAKKRKTLLGNCRPDAAGEDPRLGEYLEWSLGDMLNALLVEVELREDQCLMPHRVGSSNGRKGPPTTSALFTKKGYDRRCAFCLGNHLPEECKKVTNIDKQGENNKEEPEEPVAVETELGWVLSGPLNRKESDSRQEVSVNFFGTEQYSDGQRLFRGQS
ncbi:hypothetical protein ACROYT_G015910 [Oculina patagonica]